MHVESTFETQSSANLSGVLQETAAVTNFWVQEAPFGTGRQSVIHLGDCPLCEEGQKKAVAERWYGPFESIASARQISDQLNDVAMRAECRCVRRAVAPDVPALALLNEPLFQRPAPVVEKNAKKQKQEKVAKTTEKRKPAKAKRSRLPQYVAAGVAALAMSVVMLFVVPGVSVVEARGQQGSSPFLLANGGLLALGDVNAECAMEIPAASLKLKDAHAQVAKTLAKSKQATIPCFQMAGGDVPQTSGMILHMTVSYAVLGVHHLQQTFTFVAARTENGYCRWVLKD